MQDIKSTIQDYFVEIKEDKFTNVKTIKCKHKINWKGKELANKFMLTKKIYSHNLEMKIDYRQKNEVDSVFFSFVYSNTEDGYPNMNNLKMYLILDGLKNIELSEASGFDHSSQSSKIGDGYMSIYVETAQLALGMADFIAIVNATKIEYSIRFGQGSLENTFNQEQVLLFKGFYNAVFDGDFESETISEQISPKLTFKSKLDSSSSVGNDRAKSLQDFVEKYKINSEDLIEMSKIQGEVKFISILNYFGNEKLKIRMWKLKSKYDISFMDYGYLIKALKSNPVH